MMQGLGWLAALVTALKQKGLGQKSPKTRAKTGQNWPNNCPKLPQQLPQIASQPDQYWGSVTRGAGYPSKALLPLVAAGGRLPWASTLTAVDASPWGFGVVEASCSCAVLGRFGRLRERSRFRFPLAPGVGPFWCTSPPTCTPKAIAPRVVKRVAVIPLTSKKAPNLINS